MPSDPNPGLHCDFLSPGDGQPSVKVPRGKICTSPLPVYDNVLMRSWLAEGRAWGGFCTFCWLHLDQWLGLHRSQRTNDGMNANLKTGPMCLVFSACETRGM